MVRSHDVLTPGDPALAAEWVQLPETTSPVLFIVVDTEEEFDWSAPFSRAHTNVTAIRHIDRLQRVLSPYGVRPTYVVDFPVASQAAGCGLLKELADSGEARIGAHLHPWVNPPFVEAVNARNSFPCWLGEGLETEKIKVLQAQIASRFDRVPVVYKAGRYGFGTTTVRALESLDFMIDLSVNPRMDFRSQGGPSFADFDTLPFFFGSRRRVLEIPCSTDYTGLAGRLAPTLHRAVSHDAVRRMHLVGILARCGIVNKLMLSPEGYALGEMKALTRVLLARGVRTFSLTLHSPSLEPGCTPYVRTRSDLEQFLDRIGAYCEFFLGELSGVSSTPEAFRDSLGSTGAFADEGARSLAAR